MIKLVAFDWNGTLLADTYTVYKAAQDAYKFLGIENLTFGKFRETFTVPIADFYEANGVNKNFVLENTQKVADLFHTNYEPLAQKVRTRAHSKTVLQWLKENKIPAIIISNHIKESIDIHLKRLKIEDHFNKVIGNYKFGAAIKARNKKERLHNYLLKKGINPQEVLIVGDSIEEVEIAKELGTISAAITHGNCSTPRLKAAKPDYLISDLGNLINIIREINNET